jgi:hypothetical protein
MGPAEHCAEHSKRQKRDQEKPSHGAKIAPARLKKPFRNRRQHKTLGNSAVMGALMSFALQRPLTALAILACAACSPTADRVKATVTTIDRTCDFVETTFEGKKAMSARGYTDSCNSTDEWSKVREKRNKLVSGRATLHLSYIAPQDGSEQTGELKITGRDDAFYEIKAGDQIEILVSKSDPAKIRQA